MVSSFFLTAVGVPNFGPCSLAVFQSCQQGFARVWVLLRGHQKCGEIAKGHCEDSVPAHVKGVQPSQHRTMAGDQCPYLHNDNHFSFHVQFFMQFCMFLTFCSRPITRKACSKSVHIHGQVNPLFFRNRFVSITFVTVS